jgi:hypothetical protein
MRLFNKQWASRLSLPSNMSYLNGIHVDFTVRSLGLTLLLRYTFYKNQSWYINIWVLGAVSHLR